MTSHWVGKYIGIPFLDSGFTAAGCNCWGLVHLVLRQERGIEVPTYGEISAADMVNAARRMTTDSASPPWSKCGTPQAFDVVLMTAKEGGSRFIGHAGIMTSPMHLLHVWKATDAVNMAIDHPRVRHRIVGFWRHEALV